MEYGVTHVVAAKDGSDKAIKARKIPGCVLVRPGWLVESYWSMSKRDVQPYLMGQGSAEALPTQAAGILKESNIENSTDGSSGSDDDGFADELAAEF